MKTFILCAFSAYCAMSAASILPLMLENREIKPSGQGPIATTTNLVFTDGAIYNALLPTGAFTEQFNLDLAIWTQTSVRPYTLALVTRQVGAVFPYSLERRLLQPFVDQTPGAPRPVAFTADNATLSADQTTYGWRNGERLLYFAPDDSAPAATGMQWIPTQYAGVGRLFWNQTLFEFNKKQGLNYPTTTFLIYSIEGFKWVDNLPAIFN